MHARAQKHPRGKVRSSGVSQRSLVCTGFFFSFFGNEVRSKKTRARATLICKHFQLAVKRCWLGKLNEWAIINCAGLAHGILVPVPCYTEHTDTVSTVRSDTWFDQLRGGGWTGWLTGCVLVVFLHLDRNPHNSINNNHC